MKLVPRWLPELTLRTLRVVVIGLMLLNVWSVYHAYVLQHNPLIPEALNHYKTFPYYFFIGFYSFIILVIWKILKGEFASKNWWLPVIAVVLFESSKFFIYGFLMWVNPFG